jgi:Raf kinase inhibitor-like YbhB/YbcL family protein
MNALILFFMSIISVKNMEVESPAFKAGGYIPVRYTCEGKNINPPIHFKEIPQATKSIALIIEDPDATKGTFDHWVIWNIEPGKFIAENSVPGVEGKNGSGKIGYTGPCPPAGTGIHHYHFKVYALDKKLSLEKGSDKIQLQEAMQGHIIAQSEMIGLCTKEK